MAEQKSTSSGIGLSGAVFIVFLVLKLTGTIDWSWWWVTCPLWIPVAVTIIAFILYVIIDLWQIRKRGTKFQQRIRQFEQERNKVLEEQKKRG